MRRRSALEQHRAGDFFVLRSPLLPFAEFAALNDDDLITQLRVLCADPQFREALFLSSPDLVEQTQRWDELTPARAQQLAGTIYKYVSRTTTRCAPFGTFAGYSIGRIGPLTDFSAFSDTARQRQVELSPAWLRQVVDSKRSSSSIRESGRWYRNPAARTAAEAIRFIERHVDGGSYSYALSEVDASPLIVAALDAATGATGDEIAATIMAADADVTEEEAHQFVDDLIDAQLLVSSFELPLSSDDAADDAIRLLRAHGLADMAAALEQSAAALDTISKGPLGASVDTYRQIASELQPAIDIDPARMFNATLTRSGTPEIGPEIIAEVDRAVALLHRITRPERTSLHSFAGAFSLRWGTRDVPLLEALDPETGISFPPVIPDSSPLIAGLQFPAPPGEGRSDTWSDRDDVLLNLLCESIRAGQNEIALTDADLSRLAKGVVPLPLPDTFSAHVSIAAGSEDDLRRGDFRLIANGASGPSAARMFTRFCASDRVLLDHVRQHIADEERCRPDAVFAEVLHLPEGHHAVVASRPPLRGYEIPLLAVSSLPVEQQIPLDDLLVSVIQDRVLLYSRRLGREVIPCLTTAHNIGHVSNAALYRFFGALAVQGRACSLSWDWGRLAAAAYLPRVTAGRLVLSPQRWRVSAEELKAMAGDDEQMIAWCRQRGLPRFVRIAREIVVDLSTAIGRATLRDAARGGASLTELLPDPENLWLGGERPFVHEILVPYVSTADVVQPRVRGPYEQSGKRVFVPGSEWLYAKLYTGQSSVDRILLGPISDLAGQLREEGIIDRWFFIRYGDPDWHLRVRFHGDADALAAVALPRLRGAVQAHLDAGVISRFELAAYDREVERYGGWGNIDLAEAIFHVDSEMVVEALSSIGSDTRERWHAAVAGADRLLDDFGCAIDSKRSIVQDLRTVAARFFDNNKQFTRQLGDRFRQLRSEVEASMTSVHMDGAVATLLRRRSERLAPLLDEMRRRERDGRLSAPIAAIAGSFVHMFLNRIMRGSHSRQELVICDFLDRAYESFAMRSRTEVRRRAAGTE
jgi:thiopeptide-type bacteriocin biosynthesis protein